MICPNCGKDNKETSRFCAHCGTKMEKTETKPEDAVPFEDEKTMILEDAAPFEDEKTMILEDAVPFEDEKTVILEDAVPSEDEKTVIYEDASPREESDIPTFDYHGHVPVYREPAAGITDGNRWPEYIDEIRGLKGLLDDGIITEWEFDQKKKILLGL